MPSTRHLGGREPAGPLDQEAFTRRVFKVQFHTDANISGQRICGRVEHLRSGDALHFQSLEELLRFFQSTLEARG